MSIIQISKIQHRSGNLVDLPQLSEGELGWATDKKRLFIGKEVPAQNIEVLTSYSNISFSQINGSGGNISVTNATNGQVMAFNGTDWTNRGGTAGGLIDLGTASNVRIRGGSVNYVLTTDGTGNLAWTPKGALYVNILGLAYANNTVVMTVDPKTPYTNDAIVTISGVQGNSNVVLNGQSFFVRLDNNFSTTGNLRLYTSSGGTGNVSAAGLTYTNPPEAVATSLVGGGSGIGGGAAGPTYSIQYNNGGIMSADANLIWNFTSRTLNVTGNLSATNLAGNLTATVANITTINGSNIVATLANVSTMNANTVSVTGNISANRGAFTTVSGNGAALTNLPGANISGQVANALVASRVYTNAQPNITSVGTLTNLTIAGNLSVGNTVTAKNLTTGGASTVGNITGNWVLTAGSRLEASYADLAEMYLPDADYPPGTVLEFGGEHEVRLASNESTAVAGVVSTNPAYVMNHGLEGGVAIALQGRVPCKVLGHVCKGDLMVSAGNGFAKSMRSPAVGTVIGKSLETDLSTGEKVIEIVVGRV